MTTLGTTRLDAATNTERVPTSLHGYQILQRLGRGAASTLYVACDPATRSLHALKHVVRRPGREREDQRFLDQAENEHEIASSIDHPGIRAARRIIRIRSMLRVSEIVLLLDFVDGAPLDRIPTDDASQILRWHLHAARALAALHAGGFVHADLKPGNMIDPGDGTVVLIDLGQACEIGARKPRIQGTPGFMAPEQRRLEPLGPATDAFALGASILRTTLHGRFASELGSAGSSAARASLEGTEFPRLTADADAAAALLAEHCAADSLVSLVRRLLAPRPQDRPSSMLEIAEILEEEVAAGVTA